MNPIRALVVDDSKAMRRAIIYALGKIGGLTCVEAEDGAQALKFFSEQPFEIVLTDINMPLMDGLKLITHIRQNLGNAQVPIVVITTESAAEDRSRALSLGASAYLTKPIQAVHVLQTVKTLLKLA